jgi:hypothetical protein
MDAGTGPEQGGAAAGAAGAAGPEGPVLPRRGRPGRGGRSAVRRQGMTRNVKRDDTLLFPEELLDHKYAPDSHDPVRQEFTFVAKESGEANTKLRAVAGRFPNLICRYSTHDWFALAYPPARRWECLRCGVIREEAPSFVPNPRPVPRVAPKRVDRPSRG